MRNSNELDDIWTTVATFSWYQDAVLLKMRLEASGIDCLIPEQFTGTINPGTTGMTVRVLVKGTQLEDAQNLIALPPEPEAAEACPKCGSTDLQKTIHTKRNWFRALFGLLLVTPMRGKESKVCGSCGLRF